MNRKTFLQLVGGVAAAIGLGLKGKAKSVKDHINELSDKLYPGWRSTLPSRYEDCDLIEIAGIPVYYDPYCPEDTMYVFKTDRSQWEIEHNMERAQWVYWCDQTKIIQNRRPMEPRRAALLTIIDAARTKGGTPSFAIVGPKRWANIKQAKDINWYEKTSDELGTWLNEPTLTR